MTPEQAIERLKSWQGEDQDEEIAHLQADNILCELLSSVGFQQVVDEYEKIHKWYA